MKKALVVFVALFWAGAWAQEGSVQEFQQSSPNSLRVAETPCPEEVAPKFPEATCYLHDYPTFSTSKKQLDLTSLVSAGNSSLGTLSP